MFFKARYKFGEITKRWGDANFKKEFDTILDNWLNQFSEEEKPVLLNLLKNFYYYTETSINKKVVELHQKFLAANGEDISNVLFAKILHTLSFAVCNRAFTRCFGSASRKIHGTQTQNQKKSCFGTFCAGSLPYHAFAFVVARCVHL